MNLKWNFSWNAWNVCISTWNSCIPLWNAQNSWFPLKSVVCWEILTGMAILFQVLFCYWWFKIVLINLDQIVRSHHLQFLKKRKLLIQSKISIILEIKNILSLEFQTTNLTKPTEKLTKWNKPNKIYAYGMCIKKKGRRGHPKRDKPAI